MIRIKSYLIFHDLNHCPCTSNSKKHFSFSTTNRYKDVGRRKTTLINISTFKNNPGHSMDTPCSPVSVSIEHSSLSSFSSPFLMTHIQKQRTENKKRIWRENSFSFWFSNHILFWELTWTFHSIPLLDRPCLNPIISPWVISSISSILYLNPFPRNQKHSTWVSRIWSFWSEIEGCRDISDSNSQTNACFKTNRTFPPNSQNDDVCSESKEKSV